MRGRRLLCVIPRDADAAVCEPLHSAGWEVQVTADHASAGRVLQDRSFRVGLLLFTHAGDTPCTELRRFLESHSWLEWVGAFDPRLLQLSTCRAFIVEHA